MRDKPDNPFSTVPIALHLPRRSFDDVIAFSAVNYNALIVGSKIIGLRIAVQNLAFPKSFARERDLVVGALAIDDDQRQAGH